MVQESELWFKINEMSFKTSELWFKINEIWFKTSELWFNYVFKLVSLINILTKTKVNLNCSQILSYYAVNTLRLGYKNQPVNVV